MLIELVNLLNKMNDFWKVKWLIWCKRLIILLLKNNKVAYAKTFSK